MIANHFFPAFAAHSANLADGLIAWQGRAARVAVSLDIRVATRRNDLLNPSLGQGLAQLPQIVSAVAVKTAHRADDLFQQVVHLVGIVTEPALRSDGKEAPLPELNRNLMENCYR